MLSQQKFNLLELISEEKIQNRVAELAQELTTKFKDEKEPITVICVLSGSFIFFSDLIRKLKLDVICDFYGCQSYSQGQTTGEVKVSLDLNHAVSNKHVILVEDIVDTGLTLKFLTDSLNQRGCKSLTTVSLLDKKSCRKVDINADFVGFDIGTEFVVGYGLDFDNNFRHLPYVAELERLDFN